MVNKRTTQCTQLSCKPVLWRWIRRKVTSHHAKSSTRGRLIVQICQEKDVLCRWIRHKVTSHRARFSTRGRLNTQSCLEKDVFWRWISWIRRKVTCRRARLSTRGQLNTQSCLEKDALYHWIRHKVTSRRAKIVKKRMSQYAKLSWKRRLLTLN